MTYDFRRNLFGLKTAAFDALIVVGWAIAFWLRVSFDMEDAMGAKLMFIGALLCCMLHIFLQ